MILAGKSVFCHFLLCSMIIGQMYCVRRHNIENKEMETESWSDVGLLQSAVFPGLAFSGLTIFGMEGQPQHCVLCSAIQIATLAIFP